MEQINDEWVYTEETQKAALKQFGCSCDSCCAIAYAEAEAKVDRAISILTECGCKFDKGGWVTATCEHGREFVQTSKNASWKLHEVTERPTIVCLCGSTRFWRTFQEASLCETLAGKIVLSIGAASATDDDHFGHLPVDEIAALKERLDVLHFRKIDLANEVLILNVGGYIGESTSRELAYAKARGKQVWFWEADDEN